MYLFDWYLEPILSSINSRSLHFLFVSLLPFCYKFTSENMTFCFVLKWVSVTFLPVLPVSWQIHNKTHRIDLKHTEKVQIVGSPDQPPPSPPVFKNKNWFKKGLDAENNDECEKVRHGKLDGYYSLVLVLIAADQIVILDYTNTNINPNKNKLQLI